MKRLESASQLLKRVGLVVGVALLAGILLTVSIAVSAEPARPATVGAGLAPAPLDAPVPAPLAAQSAPAVSARPSRSRAASKVSTSADPAEAVQRAWQRASDLGVYHFATSLLERRYPAPSLANVGSGPQVQEAYLDGEADLPARKLTLRLWTGGGSAANASDAAEMLIEGDKAYTRRVGSGAWQPVEDFSGGFAPDSDPLAFLAGIKNVRLVATEERRSPFGGAEGNAFTFDVSRFTFDVDGPALATYMRDRLEEVLREQGKLPLGVTLSISEQYRDLSGQGEVWVNEAGLPLRLSLHLTYPPARNGAHSEADLQTDFSGFPSQLAAAPSFTENPLAWADTAFQSAINNPQSAIREASSAGRWALALSICLGLAALIVVCRRSSRVYVAVAVAVILAMTVAPLLQNLQVSAYLEKQAAQQAKAAEGQQAEQRAQEFAAQQASWDPHRDPLASDVDGELATAPSPLRSSAPLPADEAPALRGMAPAQDGDGATAPPCDDQLTDDDDKDGLSDYQECLYGTDTTTDDTDTDALSDGQEVSYLGTNPTVADTDGDMITDTLEVQGFVYPAAGQPGSQHWHLDPRSTDTNGDGTADGVECPPLRRGDTSAASIDAECDTDGDTVPDPFDDDNDNDGVPDKVDLSPDGLVDRGGVRGSGAGSIQPFSAEQPFAMTVSGLEQNWPVFLDVQLRPEDPKHLTYALNVLDWPAEDDEGQIERVKDTTWFTTDNTEIRDEVSDSANNGDMKLVPVLEIEMHGSSLPLKLTTPAITPTVGSGTAVSATVAFLQDAADAVKTHITFTFEQPGSYHADLYAGACPGSGEALWSATDIADGQDVLRVGDADGWLNSVADSNHALVISSGATSACATMPNIVNGQYANQMVDLSVLQPYGIGLRELSNDPNTPVVAYVPLSTVSDDTTGGRTAFSARMPYWVGGDSAWAESQEMRVSWAVQALTDSCDTEGFPENLEEYQKEHPGPPEATQEDYDEAQEEWCLDEAHRTTDELQVIQTYDDPFHITGLKMTEDHGLDVAVAYPNPSIAYDENPLWQLSWGLGQAFIPGRDCENDDSIRHYYGTDKSKCYNPDGERDLTVYREDSRSKAIGNSTLSERWGGDGSDWAGTPALWDIKPYSLTVESYRYPTSDYLSYMSTSVTPAILEKYPQDGSINPTLLFAQEERYRSAGLEAGTANAGLLTVGMSDYGEQTLAAMSWAPFRYQEDGWEAYPMDEYYDTLDTRLQAYFTNYLERNGYVADPDAVAGQTAAAEAYYMSVYNGVTELVEACPPGEEGESCLAEGEEGKSDEELIEAAEKTLDVLVDVSTDVIKETLEAIEHVKTADENFDLQKRTWKEREATYEEELPVFESIGHARANPEGSPWKTCLNNIKLGALGVSAGLAIAGVVLTVALSFLLGVDESGVELAQDILLAIGAGFGVIVGASATAKFINEFHEPKGGVAEGAGEAAEGGLSKLDVGKLVVQNLVLWAAWGMSWALGGYAAGSMAWDEKLADTVAWTLTSLVMLAIACIPVVGEIIVAVIGALDALARAICGIFLSEEQVESTAGEWLCGGITGIVQKIIGHLIYSGTILPVMDPEDFDRLEFHNFNTSDLLDPDLGVTAGNSVKYTIGLTNTIELAPQPSSMVSHDCGWWWTAEYLAHSNFEYEWQAEEEDIHKELSLRQIPAPGWQDTGFYNRLFYSTTVDSEAYFALPETGINRPADLYLSEGYAVPECECWGLGLIAGCDETTVKDTAHYPFTDSVRFDVLPANLSDFYQLQGTQDGYRLAWDAQFPPLTDADGDGLAYDAGDPNDALWDTDGDGLSDQYEAGTSDATLRDTDRDGLNDYQEAQLGTDPRLPDSDADGLYDCHEVFHKVVDPDQLGTTSGDVCGTSGWSGGWEFVYGWDANGKQLVTRVHSDPLDSDADADSYPDSREKVYGFHPGVPSQSELLSLDSQMTETGPDGKQTPSDNTVAPGATLQYTATVKNALDAREAEGLLWTEGSSALDQSGLAPQSFLLMPQDEKAMAGSLGVASGAASGVYSVTQVAGAQITDWSEISGDADLWLPFDDAADAASYLDTSGNIPSHNGQCVDLNGNPATGPCTILTGTGKTGNALQLNGQGYVRSGAAVNDGAHSYVLWFRLPSAAGEYTLLATDNWSGPVLTVSKGSDGVEWLDAWEGYDQPQGIYPVVWQNHTPYLADGWWHQVAVTCSGDTVRLYLDGAERGWTKGILCSGGSVRVGGPSPNSTIKYGAFSGPIDDVRVYPTALTDAQVSDLYNQPVFRMDFDQHFYWSQNDAWVWKDVSGWDTPVTIPQAAGGWTPKAIAYGAVGWGGKFGVESGLNTVPNQGQPLSVGETSPNAQLDLSGGKFTLSAWLYPYTESWCTGVYQEEYILGIDPYWGSYPSLIRAADDKSTGLRFTATDGKLRSVGYGPALALNAWNHLVVTYDKDGAANTGLAKFYLNGELRSTQPLGNSGEHPAPKAATHFYIGAPGPFYWDSYRKTPTYGFCGAMDEVQILSYVLTDQGVKDLMLGSATALHLPLDEPPGATVFADDSTVHHGVSCGNLADCPTSGVAGRVNQGAQFNSAPNHSSDHLVLQNSELNSFIDRVTAAAWVKLNTTAPAYQTLAGTVIAKSDDGWSFGVKGSDLFFTLHGVKEYVSSGANLQTGRWCHVAAVFDAANSKTLQFYLDGKTLGAAITNVSGGRPDTADQFYIGASTQSSDNRVTNPWHGSIDDLVVSNSALKAETIRDLYSAAPAVHLRLDDAQGATSFANEADPANPGSCTGSTCPLAGEGIKGQIGLAAQFDGQDDSISVPHSAVFDAIEDQNKVTIVAWTKIHGWYAGGWFDVVDKYKSSGDFGWVFQINSSNGLNFMASQGSYTYCSYVPPLDQWVHLAVTYDKSAGKALYYVNGQQQCSTNLSADIIDTANGPLYMGYSPSGGDDWSNGLLDEVRVYDHALTAADIHDMYVYENGWVEDCESRNLTVDSDDPTAVVQVGDKSYQANWPAQVLVTAEDATSDVEQVQLCVNGACGDPAPRCDREGDPAWCPTFSPTGQGVYHLSARATDRVGKSGAAPAQEVYVDDSAPKVTLNPPGDSWYTATEYEGGPYTWAVPFSGTVSDPQVSSGVDGIGIPADGVRVTVYREDGGVVSTGTQTATVTSGAWALDYLFADADPSGCYTVRVEAVDAHARDATLPPSQKERHTTTLETDISIEADSPPASIDWSNLPAGQLGPATSVVKGDASENPVPVVLTFTGGRNSAQSQVVLSCQHGNEGDWWDPYSSAGVQLEPGQVTIWDNQGKPIIHHLSTCKVELTTSADSDDLFGNVSVCGEQILEWSGDFTKPGKTNTFTVDSPGCTGGNGCPVGKQKATADVKGVDVSFLPVTPGSTLFNDVPPSGEVLHLTMDTGQDSAGNLTFPDASGHNLTGTCSGSDCPMTGQQGHSGRAALFDGISDVAWAPDSDAIDFGAAQDFAVAIWINPAATQPDTSASDNAILEKWSGGGTNYPYVIRYDNQKAGADEGKVYAARYDYTNGRRSFGVTSTQKINDGRFHQVVFVRSGGSTGSLYLYVDGQLQGQPVAENPTLQATTNSSGLYIGARGNHAYHFAGLIDDVRIFNRGLSADEVKALYQGSEPLLVLPFDKQWAADGSVQEDTSGWQHDGTLHTGEGDRVGKSVTGQAGAYALQFDGVDDYVSVEPDAGLDLSGGQFTEAAWIYPDLADGGYHGFVGYEPPGGEKERYPGLWLHQTNRVLVGFGDGTRWNAVETSALSGIQPQQWSHVASTFDGTTYRIYLNGSQVYATTKTSGGLDWSAVKPYTRTEGIWVGKTETKFRGQLDDVRVYPRALSEAEIQALYLSGWQAAAVTLSSQSNRSAQWQINRPKWLEGSYRIEARGWDTAGHTSPPRGSAQTWSGEADTLGPRVTLTRSPSGNAYRYKMTAQDYNLTQNNLSTPCPSGTAVVTTTFQSPWYMAALPTSPRLYQLVVDCTLSSPAASETAKACDTFGNCTTVNATVTASAAEVAGGEDAGTGDQSTVSSQQSTVPRLIVSPGIEADVELGPGGAAAAGKAMRPALGFVPTVLTTTHLYPRSVVGVTGVVTNARVIKDVVVSVGGVSGPAILSTPADKNALTANWRFPWPLGQSPLLDGVHVTAVVTGTRAGGKPIVETAQLLVDVAPPSQVPLTLKSNGQVVEPGNTVRTVAPEFVLTWPPASDGSGVAGYQVRWTAASSVTTTQTVQAIRPAGPLADRYTAGEAERITVDLGSRDELGNVRWQELGPVYADSPLTPDIIALGDNPYLGWQESGCTFLGADRRLDHRLGRGPQRLYATWDQAALRLAWTGATWSGDGDLFVYLDTGPGGTSSLYHPAGATDGGVKLTNGAMQADYAVWVQDAATATLLQWDGGAWATVADLSDGQYRFGSGRQGGQTDLYLPFDLINANPGSSLGLLAVAAEEPVAGQELRLWATLPQFNPVNSPRVNRMLNFVPQDDAELVLKHAYRWPALDGGVCPNSEPGAHYGDVHPQLNIQSDPPGVGLSGLSRGLFWVPDSLIGGPSGLDHPALRFATPGQPVGAGQTIVFTVRYRNAGTETQHGVRLVLTGNGVTGLPESVTLGDDGVVKAGEEVSKSFQGEVPENFKGAWAAVKGLLYDAAHPTGAPLDWLSMTHRVDQTGPAAVRITRPTSTVGPARAAVEGVAYDESGVNSVELETTGPGGTRTIPCTVLRAAEGRWQCAWNVGGAEGDQFTLRAHAIDVYGHDSWSKAKTVRVDARPPELRLTTPLTATVRGGVLLLGSALDDSGITVVRVCVEGECGRASLLGVEGSATRWVYRLPNTPSDYVSNTISIDAMDRVGNQTQPLEVSFTRDNVAPALTASQEHADVPLGQKQMVLQGHVQDGGPDPRVFVLVRGPDGARARHNAARDGDRWWYELPGDMLGRYTLWLQAVDRTGNVRTMGPYAVDVTCTDARLVGAVSTQGPAPAIATYTVTAVITNTGPMALAAGVPMTLYAGGDVLAGPLALPALAIDASAEISATWTAPGPGTYGFAAVLNRPRAVALCRDPLVQPAMLNLGPTAGVDLVVSQTVQPAAALPGDVITYTVVYSNAGAALATGVVISDPLPAEIVAPAYQSTGAAITLTAGSGTFAWQVADLAGGQGGRIVISGTVDPAVTPPIAITSTVTVTAPLDVAPGDNVASAVLPVLAEIPQPAPKVWLPWIVRE